MCRRFALLLMPIAAASAVAACETSSRVVAVDRQPSAILLLPCQDPELVPDAENATDEQIEVERINVARAYVECRQRHADLVTFVKLGNVKGGVGSR
jgi:hypothetical protein